MLKREWGGKQREATAPSKTATYVPEFATEDLSLGRIPDLMPEFAVKDLPLGRSLMMTTMMMMIIETMETLFKTSSPVVQWLSHSPLDPRFAGSIPARVDGFFQSVKILSMTSFGREVKPWVPCRRFTARKRISSRN